MNGFGDFRENWLDGLSRETYIYTSIDDCLKGLPLWRLCDEHGKSLKGSCLRVYPSILIIRRGHCHNSRHLSFRSMRNVKAKKGMNGRVVGESI